MIFLNHQYISEADHKVHTLTLYCRFFRIDDHRLEKYFARSYSILKFHYRGVIQWQKEKYSTKDR